MEVVNLGTQTLILRSPMSLTPFISSRMRTIPPSPISQRGGRRRNSLRHKLLPTHHLPIHTPNINNDILRDVDVDVNVNVEGEDNIKDMNENICDLVPSKNLFHFSNTSVLPTFGFGVFSFLFLFAFSKLFVTLFSSSNNEEDMSPLHSEMLRRKIKSRMNNSLQQQEEASSVGVELVVVEDKSTSTPPPLDHSLLFDTIRQYPHSQPPPVVMDVTTITNDNTSTTAVATNTTTTNDNTSTTTIATNTTSIATDHSHNLKHESHPAKPNDNIRITTLRKPKLILSLNQAREYLSHKHQEIPTLDETHDSNHFSTSYTSLHVPFDASDSTEGSLFVDDISTDLENEVMRVNLDRHEELHAAIPNDIHPYPAGKSSPIHGAYDEQGSCSEEEEEDTYDEQGSCSEEEDERNIGRSGGDNQMWLQSNFHEVEPILNKIGAGFKNNYMMAREKVKEQDISLDFLKFESFKDDTELDWMQNDQLRDIVFRVRDNELAGRDPFHSIDPEDKLAFFNGLESKVHQENEKLSTLHAWLHSNIENIDYGADGISLHDPPDKIVPRWKGPSIDKIPESLTKPAKQPKVASSVQKANESSPHDNTKLSRPNATPKEVPKLSKTIIEGSDGSIKPGKKSGKEYWQHTKKWSRGFLESYNAESDPEVKSVMKDVGKGLDRWITEDEIQEAATFMDKIQQRGSEYIKKKLSKVKREMEQFGPAAVVSKYREYGDDKEEDYLWWLDLRYVLCIELYTYADEDQRVGFYSLEMATDLELDPKPHHVIGFEDPGDCKNLCYIIQAHLEMLGNGSAFVVAQPPKDVFREAKANGFGVTVIRKGEVHLNIDQSLEEVEESITEIGSKMYHDKLMRERSVDINSLMKGVFGITKPSKRKTRKRAQTNLPKQ